MWTFFQWVGAGLSVAAALAALSFVFYFLVYWVREFVGNGAKDSYYLLRYWLWYAVHRKEENLLVCDQGHQPIAFFSKDDRFRCPICHMREGRSGVLPYEALLEWAKKNPPPQSWYEEHELTEPPPAQGEGIHNCCGCVPVCRCGEGQPPATKGD